MLRSVVNQSFYRRLLASSVKNEPGFVRSFASKSEERITAASLSYENEWESFKAEYNKVYADEREEALRKTIFFDNLMKIKAHNERADNGEYNTWRLGVNKFADMTNEEFKATYLGFKAMKEQ